MWARVCVVGVGGSFLFTAGTFSALPSEMSENCLEKQIPNLMINLSNSEGKLDTVAACSAEVKGKDRMRARSPSIVSQAGKWHYPSGAVSLPS